MNVWVVSFDKSEKRDDPLLRVFANRASMDHAVRKMAGGPFYAEVAQALDEGGGFTLVLDDDDFLEHIQLHVRTASWEEAETVLAKGVL